MCIARIKNEGCMIFIKSLFFGMKLEAISGENTKTVL